ncbi:MAG: riboflavin synthase [Pirellulaceae bacterium]
MFSGLVQKLGKVAAIEDRPPGVRLVVDTGELAAGAAIGASVAVNGCCLTVVGRQGEQLAFDAGAETLSRTNLGRLKVGDRVNLETSLKIGDELGGHFVTGHIDAVGTLDERIDEGDWSTCWYRVPARLTTQMAGKGSVAVDGVSLTLVDVEDERFSVALIPHTLAATTLGSLALGGQVNIETDVLAKYVARAVSAAMER